MAQITAERLREFTALLQKYKSGKASLERRVVSAENWWKLRNRFEERRGGLSDDGGFRSASGWLHNVIVSKHADAMDAYPEPLILPREQGDRDQARLLSAILPCILEQNRFEKTYDAAMWQKLKTGTACYRVVWDPEKCGGLGDIAIERVDLLNLFWEPGVDDIQKSRCFFCTHLEDEETLCEKYPQLRGRVHGSPFRATRFVYDDAVSLEGKVTVIEVYYKKRGVLHYCKYVGDTVLYATENQIEAPALRFGKEEGGSGNGAFAALTGNRKSGIQRASSDADTVLYATEEENPDQQVLKEFRDEHLIPNGASEHPFRPSGTSPGGGGIGLYDHGKYPFVFDPLFPVEGSPCGYGFVDLCANVQTAIDLMRTAFVKNTLVGATPRYFERIDGSVNEEEFTDLSRALVHVSGNLGEDSLRQIGFAGLPGVYVEVLESTIRELRETSGNTETATGTMNVGVTAASAIMALQEASGKGSRDSTRASYQAFAEIVELCIELIRQFYTLPRQFRITGVLGGDDFVLLDNAALLPRALPGLDALHEPVFDIKVSAQKRNAYSRLSQNELAMELYRLGLFEPGHEQQALGMLDMMEFDGKEQMMARLAATQRLREKLHELEGYKAFALALARRYRPELASGLTGEAYDPSGAARHLPLRRGGEEKEEPSMQEEARAQANLAPLPG